MQDAEEYYRRTLSAKYLPINPDSKTPSVDKAIRLTGLIVDRMRAWESYELTQEDSKSIREVFAEETQFFDEPDADKEFRKAVDLDDRSWYYKEPHKPNWYFLTLEIESEIRAVFHNRNESALQDRDANYLIDNAVNLILPTYLIEHGSLFTKWDGSRIVKTNHIVFSDDEVDSVKSDNVFFRTNFIQALHSWGKKITDYVSMYAPEVYEKHRERIEFYFRHGEPAPTTEPAEQPAQPDDKLSAPQKLLFIRLLQQTGLFPQKPNGTDDAPELRAIALLTGLDFGNDIKGGTGAKFKVNQLLNNRQSLTIAQIPYKIADLDKVAGAARLLNVEPVLSAIDVIRADLEKLRQS